MVYSFFYKSPIGYLRIITTKDTLTNIGFIDGAKPSSGGVSLDASPDIAKKTVHELDLYFSGKLTTFTVPFSQSATPFRRKVYSELIKIPYGSTISYKQLAERIGNPNAVRAVGGANHNNSIQIIVPCHRVIGADGSLTGYGGGLHAKRYLLELEQSHSNT